MMFNSLTIGLGYNLASKISELVESGSSGTTITCTCGITNPDDQLPKVSTVIVTQVS